MSARCAETISQRRGTVSLRCDRAAGHEDSADDRMAWWHYDAEHDAEWRTEERTWADHVLTVRYEIEGGT